MPSDPDPARRNLFITAGSIVVIAVGLLVHAKFDAAHAAEAEAHRAALDARVAAVEVRRIEINSASLAELQTLIVLGEQTARDIVNARTQRAFRDWADVVHRIIALSSARNAAEASISGLTVNGEALSGAEMNPVFARMIARRVFERG